MPRNPVRLDESSETEFVSSESTLTRRRVVIGITGAAGALVATPALAASMLRHDDHDDDDDDDNDDDHDDNEHDDHDDLDDDNDDIREAVVEGSTEVHIIDDDADGFYPAVLRIATGETVTFLNDDDDAHTATGANFDTGILQPGDSAEVTFATEGIFAYSCQIHPVMFGTIEVGTGQTTPDASPAATPEVASNGEEVTVTIANIAFDPVEVDVAVGTTVRWINQDQVPHTATALDGTFDTGTLQQGDEGRVTFDTPGAYEYRCSFHPSMTAVINVN